MSLPSWFIWLISAAIVLYALVVGSGFLIPVAIALVLFSLLSALIDRITRVRLGGWSVPRPLAIAVGLAIVTYGLLVIFNVLSTQVDAVIAAVPRYMTRIEAMLAETADIFGRDIAEDLQRALSDINITARLPGLVGSAGAVLTVIIMIILYMGFMFVERPMFDTKIGKMFPEETRVAKVRQVIGSIGHSVQRYFSIKIFVSALTGLLAYAVMKPMGLDFAETWALLTFFLNFIPSIGSAIATILPALIALVQFDSFGPFIVIALGVGAVQFVIGNFVEPALAGRSLNLSPLVIIVSLTFWASVWGVVGMFLAVPIMVIVMIVCSHIPGGRPVAVLLSRNGEIPEGGTEEV